MFNNFVTFSSAVKDKAHRLNYNFTFPVSLPHFYTPEPSLVENLRNLVIRAQEEAEHS